MNNSFFSSRAWYLVLLLLGIAVSLPASAQEVECVDYQNHVHMVGNVGGVYFRDMLERGMYLYSANYSEFTAVDIRDRRNPVITNTIVVPTGATEVEPHSNLRYAVVAGEGGLAVIDLEDPASPCIAGLYEMWDCDGIVGVAGSLALVNRTTYGWTLLDISDPTNILKLPSFSLGIDDPSAITGSGDYFYISSGSWLVVLDVSDPTDPTVSWNQSGIAYRSILFEGDLACLSHYGDGMHVYDVTDLGSPVPLYLGGGFEGFSGYDVAVVDQIAFVNSYQGFVALDISNPTLPVELCSVPINGGYGAIGAANGYVYGGYSGLSIFDTSNLTLAQPQDSLFEDLVNVNVYEMVVTDELSIFLTPGALQIYTFKPNGRPIFLKEIACSSPTSDMAICGDIVCIAGSFSGLLLLDISNPEDPAFLPPVEMPVWDEGVRYVVAEGSLAYMTSYHRIRIIDLSDPEQPQIIGTLEDQEAFFYDLVKSGDFLYMHTNSENLRIIDVSDPQAPERLGSVSDIALPLTGIAIEGNLMVEAVSGLYSELRLFDTSTPASPEFLSSLSLPVIPKDILLYQGFAYIPDHDSTPDRDVGIFVVDVRDPYQPRLTGALFSQGDYASSHLYLAGDVLYFFGPDLGVMPLQCAGLTPVQDIPFVSKETRILQARPNPFNPQTTISFSVKQTGPASLCVFDLAGRMVATLADQVFLAGEHEVDWLGRDDQGRAVSSGVYFVQVKSQDGSDTKKISLVR